MKNIIFRGVPLKWYSAPSMGPMEGPKKVTAFCTRLPYNKIFKKAMSTMDFAVDNYYKMAPACKCYMETMYKKL